MKVQTDSTSYANRFLQHKVAEAYLQQEYGPESYSTAVWAMQAPLVRKLLQEVRRRNPTARHLDFACGTGRITQLAEQIFAEVDAVDISAAMVEAARSAGRKARFAVGNILESPSLCPGPYASITAFRLLLNIDPPLRIPILAELAHRLEPDGVLIVNVHGNRHSLRHPLILWKKWRHRKAPPKDTLMLNEMSRREVERCLESAGFFVERVYGNGLLPPTLYRWPLRSLWRQIDRLLSTLSLVNRFGIDLIFVCRMKGPHAR